VTTAVVCTIGNEIVCGDVENTNASWLGRRLGELGIEVLLLAAVRDDVEAVAAAFDVPCDVIPELAEGLRGRFGPKGLGEYAARWANLPRGSVPLENPLGGAPGFVIGNVHVLPGLPSEMEAMFETLVDRFEGAPIGAWRRRYRTGEGQIVSVLEEATRRHPSVMVGSYPAFLEDGPEVEVVLKSSDDRALRDAVAWVEAALSERVAR
jgi:molybdopterin-biosynthesis enzyme MoeA-like protein